MSTSVGQALLAIVESDLATVAGTPAITLLTALSNAKGNVLAQEAAILAFIGQAPSIGVQLEVEIEQQLLSVTITKLQAFIASKATPATAA